MTKEDPTKNLQKKLAQFDIDISKMMDFALKLVDPDPAFRKIEELEKTRKTTANEITRLKRDYASSTVLKDVSEKQMHQLIESIAEELQEKEKSKLKGLIGSLVDKIILDPLSLECCIHYKIAVNDSLTMASPGGFEPPLPP